MTLSDHRHVSFSKSVEDSEFEEEEETRSNEVVGMLLGVVDGMLMGNFLELDHATDRRCDNARLAIVVLRVI